jgi:superfamily I DNA/RNA helicase
MPAANDARRTRTARFLTPVEAARRDRLVALNDVQRAAVTNLSGPMLVLAGAGTGKTRVITYRIVELIGSGIAPDRVLSVTFTNKAAREMQVRTRELIGRKLSPGPVISTFHSLCVRILREEIRHLGYPQNFRIVDRGDQESLARRVLREIRVAEKSIRPGDLLSTASRHRAGRSRRRVRQRSRFSGGDGVSPLSGATPIDGCRRL